MEAMNLQSKKVAYVGGFGGIGFACCKELISRGVRHLVILDLKNDANKLQELQNLNPNLKVHFVAIDLCGDRDKIKRALQEAISRMGYIDILINGAGILNDRNPKLTVDINLLGPIETTLAAFPLMGRPNGKGGLIVNIASVLGLEPGAFVAVYSATKHGLIGFTRSCAHEHYNKTTGISLMAICPGATVTGLIDNFVGLDTFDISRPLSETIVKALNQTVEECAKAMVDAIETGTNGSVWIVDLGKLTEVEMHKYWEYRLD